MFFSTLLTFFIVPATYVAVDRARGWLRQGARREEASSPVVAGGGS